MLPPATLQLNRIIISRSGSETIYRQMCRHIREMILNGELAIGTRFPSTRDLGNTLSVSRTTVREVYEQLVAESFLSSTSGKGTFVINHPVLNARVLEHKARSSMILERTNRQSVKIPTLSNRGKQLLSHSSSPTISTLLPFNPALPDFDLFPYAKWSRIVKRTLVNRDHAAMFYGDASGYVPLKQAIAENLHQSRGLKCDPDQVIVVASSEQAIRRIVFLLLDREDCVWFGDPGLLSRRIAIQTTGVKTLNVPVDDQGVVVSAAYKFKQQAKLAYVAPSRHYPLGHIMSLPRRLELLEWANTNDAWIIEDDFCCEFSFSGQAPPPIQSMEMNQRVIYIGGFSMTLFPSLRLAYLVVPKSLISAAENISQAEQSVSTLLQPALAEFISRGHFMTHIRNMKKTYQRREQFLSQFLNNHLDGLGTTSGTGGGSNFILNLPSTINDQKISDQLIRQDVIAHPLSSYYLMKKSRNDHANGLVMGFACSPRSKLAHSASILMESLNNYS